MDIQTLTKEQPVLLEVNKQGPEGEHLEICFVPAAQPPAPGQPGGEAGDLHLVHETNQQQNSHYRLIVSLGPRDKIDSEVIRRAGAALVRWMIKNQTRDGWIPLSSLDELGISETTSALCEGLYLGAFRFDRHKSVEIKAGQIHIHLVAGQNREVIEKIIERSSVICSAVNLARDWGHEPANIINPVSLSDRLTHLFEDGLVRCTVIDENQLAGMGAGGIISVGKGSQTPPRLIVLEYPGQPGETQVDPIVLVGKALTFDSGGYSIKDTTNIQGMKYDKCGGMVVLATLAAAAALKIKTPLVGLIGAAENMISGQAYRPDDILTLLAGKTVEIVTTDAEGRLVLADVLTYAQQKYHPRALIDLATLTGGVVVALGRVRAGLMANNEALAQSLQQSGERTFERIWQLPLDDDYYKSIKGDDADLKNSGGREGHPIFGGIFLKQFVEDGIPWAHLDIAGLGDTPKELPYCPKGATGFGVRLLIDYLENLE